MTPPPKIRFPWAHAMSVANMVVASLRPACSRIEIAGSLRREKPTVGDIEVMYVPRIEQRDDAGSLIGEKVSVNAADEVIAGLERAGFLARRKNVDGREAFGGKNKLMVHVASTIPVDLFSATEESWFNYLVCRTGGAESNVNVATAAKRKGWQWNPYGIGFSRIGHFHAVHSEREVFDFVGLQYREPRDRK